MEQSLSVKGSNTSNLSADHQVKALLNEFQPKNNHSEVEAFLCEMTKSWSAQVDKHKQEKHDASIENSIATIQAAMDAINNQGKEVPTPKVVDTISVVEFITEYCKSRITPIAHIYLEIEEAIADDCGSVVTERDLMVDKKKGVKKFNNAAKEYAYDPRCENSDFTDMFAVLALFDTTVWGSGKTGFCFTRRYVVFKDIGVPHELYYYSDIEKLGVEDEEFFIQGKSTQNSRLDYMKYNDHKATRPLTLMCQCVTDYISQPAYQIMTYLSKNLPRG